MNRHLLLIAIVLVLSNCKPKPTEVPQSSDLKISLAEWSIHRSIEDGKLKAENFATIAKNDFGITAVEYVASFYKEQATDMEFWKKMRVISDSLGVVNLLMMVDNEGDLGSINEVERNEAVENHFKWVDAAKVLGCHSIRINAFGDGTKEEVKLAMIDALRKLGAYAAKQNINVLIENHGLFSADGQWVVDIMKGVSMTNVGTLPDFGNWCTAVKWGSTEPSKTCTDAYDRYLGVSEMLPFAKGVSAKSYTFDKDGREETIDYSKMIRIVKNSGFSGYIGIEYEGSPLSESDGVKATKALLESTWKEVQ
ncbi:sugar phosphate isomerase/epimerase [soil metagenome]